MGLLFGYYSTKKGKASTIIVDAEEMEYPKLSLVIGGGSGVDKQSAGGTFAGNINNNNNNNNDNNDEESNQRIRAAILQKIELHQKVFPQHRVVGWYRVVNSATAAKHDHEHDIMNVEGELQQQQQQGVGSRTMILHNQQPTEEDLIMTQTEMTRYCGNGMINDDGASADINSPLFVLMDASMAHEDRSVKNSTENSDSTITALEELESGDELPLTVYKTLATTTTTSPTTAAPSSSGAESTVVFVNTEFELETFEPERIAVERVFKTQPPLSVASSTSTSNSSTCLSSAAVEMAEGRGDTAAAAASAINRKTGKKSKKEMDMQKQQPHPHQQQQQSSSKPAFTRGTTELDTQLVTLQSSIRAMNLRVSVLLEYLQKVERHEIPPEDTLLRSIDGLVRQLPFVLAALEERAATSSTVADGRSPLGDLEKEYSNAMLLSYLACTAKTAKAVHMFCEKFRIACESGKSDPRRSLY